MTTIETGFFDIDRTLIASGSHMLHDGLPELLDPSSRPFPFTEITARGIASYQDVLRKNPSLVPSKDLPLGLEYGTHIVTSSDYSDTSKYESVHHTPLSPSEQSQLLSFIGSVPFIRAAFYSYDPTQPRTIWLPHDSQHTIAPQMEGSKIYSGSVNSLERAIQDAQPGMVAVKIQDRDMSAEPDLPLTVFKTAFGGTTTFDFLPAHADKRNAVAHIASLVGTSREAILVAGDSAPDIGMLTISGISAVVVRNPKVDDAIFPEYLPRVNPEELAAYLTKK